MTRLAILLLPLAVLSGVLMPVARGEPIADRGPGVLSAETELPAKTIAWLHFDPRPLGLSGAQRTDQIDRIMAVSGAAWLLPDTDLQRVVATAIGSAVRLGLPVTVALIACESVDPMDGTAHLTSSSIVVLIHTPDLQREALEPVKILLGTQTSAPGASVATAMLDERVDTAEFTRSDWPKWASVMFFAVDDVAVVAIGPGAGESVVSASSGVAMWLRHADAFSDARPGATKIASAYIDLERARRDMGGLFGDGTLGRLIREWGVTNARDLMLHIERIVPRDVELINRSLPLPRSVLEREMPPFEGPPLLAASLTYSPRPQPTSVVRHALLTGAHWPANRLKIDPPEAPWVMVGRPDLREVSRSVLRSRSWMHDNADTNNIEAIDTDAARSRSSMDRLVRSLDPWFVLVPHVDARQHMLLNGFGLVATVRARVNPKRFRTDLAKVLDQSGQRADKASKERVSLNTVLATQSDRTLLACSVMTAGATETADAVVAMFKAVVLED